MAGEEISTISWGLRKLNLEESNNIDRKSFKTNQFKVECVYCDHSDHKSADCEKVKTVSDRIKWEKIMF